MWGAEREAEENFSSSLLTTLTLFHFHSITKTLFISRLNSWFQTEKKTQFLRRQKLHRRGSTLEESLGFLEGLLCLRWGMVSVDTLFLLP